MPTSPPEDKTLLQEPWREFGTGRKLTRGEVLYVRVIFWGPPLLATVALTVWVINRLSA